MECADHGTSGDAALRARAIGITWQGRDKNFDADLGDLRGDFWDCVSVVTLISGR